MMILGYIESDHVMDEYEQAEKLGRFFCRVEVDEGEFIEGIPEKTLGQVAHLAGSDEYDSAIGDWDMPRDEPAAPTQIELSRPPELIIAASGQVFRSHGSSLPCSLVPGHRYHSFVAEIS